MAKHARSTYGMTLAGALALLALVAWLAPSVSPLAQAVEGAEDTTSPTVNSISIDSSEVAAGESLTLTMDVTEEGTGFNAIHLTFRHNENDDGSGAQFSFSYEFEKAQYSGKQEFSIPVPAEALAGEWHIDSINIKDQKGNEAFYMGSQKPSGEYELGCTGKSVLESPVFAVANDVETDRDAPALTGLNVVTPEASVERPGTILVEVSFREEGSGLARIGVEAKPAELCNGTSIVRGISVERECTEEEREAGRAIIELPVDERAAVGDWAISGVGLIDAAGNQGGASVFGKGGEDTYDWITIDGVDRRTPHFTVTASGEYLDDHMAPEVTGARVLGDGVVNRPGIVRVEVSFREEGSGIDHISVSANLWEACDGKNPLMRAYGTYDAPESAEDVEGAEGDEGASDIKNVVVEVPISATDPLGDWCVTGLYLRDKAGNASAVGIHGWSNEPLYNWFLIDGQDVRAPHFEVREEFNFQLEMALSNPRLIGSLENLGEGEAARILIDDDAVLPKEALDAIAGRDVTLVLYKDAYQWVVRGGDIEGETKDVVLSLELWQEAGDEYGSNDDVVHLVFYPNGELPCPMQVRFKSDYLYSYAGISGALHLYYLDDGELVEEDGNIDLVFDGTDKWCYFDVTHNSEFIISTKVQAAGGNVPDAGQGGGAAGAGQGSGSDAKSPDGFAKETVGDDKTFSDKTQGTAGRDDLPQAGDDARLLAGSLAGMFAGLLGIFAVTAFCSRRKVS